MKNITIVLFFFSFVSAFAQVEWAPNGATWYYSLKHPNSAEESYTVFQSIKDTVINSILCKKIIKSNTTCDLRPISEYTYKEDGRVYFYDVFSNQFNLLYDFNKLSGETWFIRVNDPANYCDSLLVLVNNVTVQDINGVLLKNLSVSIFNTTSFVGFDGVINEKYGHSRNMFPYNGSSCDMEFNNGLRCYSDLVFGNFQSEIAPSCTFSTVNIDENHTTNEFKTFPMPVNDILYFNNFHQCEYTIQIFNSHGSLVKKMTTINDNINIQELNFGAYLIVFKNKDIISKKIIIKH